MKTWIGQIYNNISVTVSADTKSDAKKMLKKIDLHYDNSFNLTLVDSSIPITNRGYGVWFHTLEDGWKKLSKIKK